MNKLGVCLGVTAEGSSRSTTDDAYAVSSISRLRGCSVNAFGPGLSLPSAPALVALPLERALRGFVVSAADEAGLSIPSGVPAAKLALPLEPDGEQGQSREADDALVARAAFGAEHARANAPAYATRSKLTRSQWETGAEAAARRSNAAALDTRDIGDHASTRYVKWRRGASGVCFLRTKKKFLCRRFGGLI